MASGNASSTVLSIWELRENILRFLPCDDLARARRVSPTLKKVVDESAALQQPLFLKPRTEVSRWTITSRDRERDEDKLLAGPNMARHVKEAILRGETATEFNILELHPALMVYHTRFGCTMSMHLRDCADDSSWRSYYNATVVLFDSITDPVAGMPYYSGLDKNFLSQPPVSKVRLNLRYRRYCGSFFHPREELYVQNDTGITFGQLRDEIQLAHHQYPTAYVDHLEFGEGLPVTRRQKQAIEATGVLFWDCDPFQLSYHLASHR